MHDVTIKEAVILFHSKAELSRQLGVTKSAVTNWGDEIPWRRQQQLDSKVSRSKRLREKLKAMREQA